MDRVGIRCHTFDLLRVCSTCIMRIYLFSCRTLVQTDKSVQQVVASGVVIAATCVIWEIILQRRTWQLLSEQVDLIQK